MPHGKHAMRWNHPLFRAFRVVAGAALVLAGLAGLLLPLLQGVLLLALGLALLSIDLRFLRRYRDRLRESLCRRRERDRRPRPEEE